MSDEAPDALIAEMQAGKVAERMYGYAEEFVERERGKVEKKVFAAIESKEPLDPGLAVQAWIETHTIAQFPAKLRKEIARGEAAAKKLQGRGIL